MFGEKPILIVEDEHFIALALSLAVEDADGTVIGPVTTVAEALELIESHRIAAAVLDANLADRDVTPLALALAAKQVPFVIHTGTGVPPELAAIIPDIPVVMKPVAPTQVLDCLVRVMKIEPLIVAPEESAVAAAAPSS